MCAVGASSFLDRFYVMQHSAESISVSLDAEDPYTLSACASFDELYLPDCNKKGTTLKHVYEPSGYAELLKYTDKKLDDAEKKLAAGGTAVKRLCLACGDRPSFVGVLHLKSIACLKIKVLAKDGEEIPSYTNGTTAIVVNQSTINATEQTNRIEELKKLGVTHKNYTVLTSNIAILRPSIQRIVDSALFRGMAVMLNGVHYVVYSAVYAASFAVRKLTLVVLPVLFALSIYAVSKGAIAADTFVLSLFAVCLLAKSQKAPDGYVKLAVDKIHQASHAVVAAVKPHYTPKQIWQGVLGEARILPTACGPTAP